MDHSHDVRHLSGGSDGEVSGSLPEFEHGAISLFDAAKNGAVVLLKDLLRIQQPVDCLDEIGQTPVFYAARAGKAEIVELLCEHGCSVNVETHTNKESPLSVVADRPTAAILIGHRANVNHRDCWGQSVLNLSIQDNRLDVAQLLLESSADPTIVDQKDRNSLMIAAFCGHEELCQTLVKKYGMNPSDKNMEGKSARDYAQGSGHSFAM